MKIVSILGAATIIFSFGFVADGALAGEAPVEFTEAYLNDPATFEQGKKYGLSNVPIAMVLRHIPARPQN